MLNLFVMFFSSLSLSVQVFFYFIIGENELRIVSAISCENKQTNIRKNPHNNNNQHNFWHQTHENRTQNKQQTHLLIFTMEKNNIAGMYHTECTHTHLYFTLFWSWFDVSTTISIRFFYLFSFEFIFICQFDFFFSRFYSLWICRCQSTHRTFNHFHANVTKILRVHVVNEEKRMFVNKYKPTVCKLSYIVHSAYIYKT